MSLDFLEILGRRKKNKISQGGVWADLTPPHLWHRTSRSCLNWKKQDRQSDETWSAMLSWRSIRTPRSDTVVENWTLADSRDSSVAESLSSCCRVPSHTSCVSLQSFPLESMSMDYQVVQIDYWKKSAVCTQFSHVTNRCVCRSMQRNVTLNQKH